MRKTPLKRVNPQRKAKAFAKAYESVSRVEYIKRLPCSVLGCMDKPSENAHVGAHAGMGLKGEADTVIPLCPAHHRQYHEIGRDSFATMHRMDYAYCARMTELAWSLYNPEEK